MDITRKTARSWCIVSLPVVSHGHYQEDCTILVYCIFACSVTWTLPGRLHDLGVLYLCPQCPDMSCVCVCVMCVQMQVSPMAMERQAELQQQHNMHRLQTFQVKKNYSHPYPPSSCSHILCPNDLTPSPLQPLLFPTLSDLPSWAPSGFGQHTHTHSHNGSIHSCGLGCVFGGCLPWAIWGWV